jgi:hypothetical protein
MVMKRAHPKCLDRATEYARLAEAESDLENTRVIVTAAVPPRGRSAVRHR